MNVWFQDEARVGQKGTVTRTWAQKGSRPGLKRQQQYESAYVFGAVCPMSDEAVGLGHAICKWQCHEVTP